MRINRLATAVIAALNIPICGHARAQFTEVASAAGLNHRQQVSPSPRDCELSFGSCYAHFTGGVAVGDLDRDGLDDLVFSRLDAPMVLYRNRGDGTFEDVSSSGPGTIPGANGVALVDLDEDGRLDLLVTVLDRPSHAVYRSRWPAGFEHDATTSALFSTTESAPNSGFGLALGDFDRDGHTDVMATQWRLGLAACAEGRTRIYRGTPTGQSRLEDVTEAVFAPLLAEGFNGLRAFGGSFADLDGDGWLDLLITGDFGTTLFLWNEGGRFIPQLPPIGETHFGMGSSLADFDRDGRLDVFISGISPEMMGLDGHALYLSQEGRTFRDASAAAGIREGGWGWGTAALDVDHDGFEDVFLTTGDQEIGVEDDPTRLFHNRGDGTFAETAVALGLTDRGPGRGVALIDFDGDGDQDIVVARNATTPLLYRNDGGVAHGRYLRVRPRRADGGVAWGATVRVSRGAEAWVQVIGGATHFLGQSEPVAAFGLGSGARRVDVSVDFVGGHRVALADVGVDQTLSILEPSAPHPLPAATLPVPKDCDENGIPDACAPDCDESGTPDVCDLRDGAASDCNGNLSPDRCELRAGLLTDCDADGLPDECAIAADARLDSNGDGVLDRCAAPVDLGVLDDGAVASADGGNGATDGGDVSPDLGADAGGELTRAGGGACNVGRNPRHAQRGAWWAPLFALLLLLMRRRKISTARVLSIAAVALSNAQVAHAQPFTDVTAAAGLTHVQQTTPTDVPGATGFVAHTLAIRGGVAVGDLDEDGHPDLVFARPTDPMVVYRNRGDGSFVDVSDAVGLGSISTKRAGSCSPISIAMGTSTSW